MIFIFRAKKIQNKRLQPLGAEAGFKALFQSYPHKINFYSLTTKKTRSFRSAPFN
jgi:hypothetical protein